MLLAWLTPTVGTATLFFGRYGVRMQWGRCIRPDSDRSGVGNSASTRTGEIVPRVEWQHLVGVAATRSGHPRSIIRSASIPVLVSRVETREFERQADDPPEVVVVCTTRIEVVGRLAPGRVVVSAAAEA